MRAFAIHTHEELVNAAWYTTGVPKGAAGDTHKNA